MWRIYVVVLTVFLSIWLCIFYIPHESVNQTNTNIQKEKEIQPYKKINHHIPKFMLELYDQIQLNPNVTPPDIVRSVTPINQGFDIFGTPNKENYHLLLFKIPKNEIDERLIKAELKILTIIEDNMEFNNNFNMVHHLITISTYNEVKRNLYPIEKKKIIHQNNTWLTFNMTEVVIKAIKEDSIYLKLVISLKTYLSSNGRKLKLSLLPIGENYEHDYPILLLTYTSIKSKSITKRIKRNIVNGDGLEKKFKNSCKKRPLYVNFSEIYYDRWIIQPRGYEAFQCQGKCFYPIASHLTPTKHAVIQSLMHNLHPKEVSKICCVPIKLGSISILYVENGILTYRYAYNDMVVKECGCR